MSTLCVLVFANLLVQDSHAEFLISSKLKLLKLREFVCSSLMEPFVQAVPLK